MQAYIVDLLQKRYGRANWFDLQVRAACLRVPCLPMGENLYFPLINMDMPAEGKVLDLDPDLLPGTKKRLKRYEKLSRIMERRSNAMTLRHQERTQQKIVKELRYRVLDYQKNRGKYLKLIKKEPEQKALLENLKAEFLRTVERNRDQYSKLDMQLRQNQGRGDQEQRQQVRKELNRLKGEIKTMEKRIRQVQKLTYEKLDMGAIQLLGEASRQQILTLLQNREKIIKARQYLDMVEHNLKTTVKKLKQEENELKRLRKRLSKVPEPKELVTKPFVHVPLVVIVHGKRKQVHCPIKIDPEPLEQDLPLVDLTALVGEPRFMEKLRRDYRKKYGRELVHRLPGQTSRPPAERIRQIEFNPIEDIENNSFVKKDMPVDNSKEPDVSDDISNNVPDDNSWESPKPIKPKKEKNAPALDTPPNLLLETVIACEPLGGTIMVYGPPGTGKSFQIRRVLNYLGFETIMVNMGSMTSKYFGELTKNVQKLYEKARRHEGKVVLLFDDIDTLFAADAEHEARREVVDHLLGEIEGRDNDNSNLLQIMVTNRPHKIDSRIMQRFQRKLYFGLPQFDWEWMALLKEILKPFRFSRYDPFSEPERLLHFAKGKAPRTLASTFAIFDEVIDLSEEQFLDLMRSIPDLEDELLGTSESMDHYRKFRARYRSGYPLNKYIKYAAPKYAEAEEYFQRYLLEKTALTGPTFSDVIGHDMVKATLVKLFETQQRKFKQQEFVNSIPMGVLFGPPGTGKGYITSALQAQFQVPVFHVNMTEINSAEQFEQNVREFMQVNIGFVVFDEAEQILQDRQTVVGLQQRIINTLLSLSYPNRQMRKYLCFLFLMNDYVMNLDRAIEDRLVFKLYLGYPTLKEYQLLLDDPALAELALSRNLSLRQLYKVLSLNFTPTDLPRVLEGLPPNSVPELETIELLEGVLYQKHPEETNTLIYLDLAQFILSEGYRCYSYQGKGQTSLEVITTKIPNAWIPASDRWFDPSWIISDHTPFWGAFKTEGIERVNYLYQWALECHNSKRYMVVASLLKAIVDLWWENEEVRLLELDEQLLLDLVKDEPCDEPYARARYLFYLAKYKNIVNLNYEDSLIIYKEALKIFTGLKETQWVAKVHNNLGQLHFFYHKDLETARRHYQIALQINLKENNLREVAYNQVNLGTILLEKNHVQEAFDLFINALPKVETKKREPILRNIAEACLRAGLLDEALVQYRQTLNSPVLRNRKIDMIQDLEKLTSSSMRQLIGMLKDNEKEMLAAVVRSWANRSVSAQDA